jgi:hypothetical protein
MFTESEGNTIKPERNYVMRKLFEAISKAFVSLSETYPTFVAVIIVALLVLLGLGLAFGGFVFIGFILMSIYNAIASHTGWPLFTIWFWTAVVVALNWLIRGICIKCNNTDD